MPAFVKDIQFSQGYITVTFDSGPPKKLPIVDMLPALTYQQVAAVKVLANLVVILIRTLIERQVLNESFLENDEMDLDHIIQVIELMGGAYHDPDLSSV